MSKLKKYSYPLQTIRRDLQILQTKKEKAYQKIQNYIKEKALLDTISSYKSYKEPSYVYYRNYRHTPEDHLELKVTEIKPRNFLEWNRIEIQPGLQNPPTYVWWGQIPFNKFRDANVFEQPALNFIAIAKSREELENLLIGKLYLTPETISFDQENEELIFIDIKRRPLPNSMRKQLLKAGVEDIAYVG
jgi:hypothetical protein